MSEMLNEEKVIEVSNGDVTKEYDLVVGYLDPNGVCHDTFTLREMDGTDEEAISKGDVKSNPSRAINVLLARCCLSIGSLTKKDLGVKEWEKIIKSLYVGDQDIMILKLREISVGKEIEVVHKCPNPDCKTELRTFIDIDELDIVPFDGERTIPFTLPNGYKDSKGVVHNKGTMRLPTGYDREILVPLAKKNEGKAKTAMLVRVCTFDDGLIVTDDVMKKLVLKDRNYLQKLLSEHIFGVKLTVDVTCTNCGEEFVGNLNAVNFISARS